VVCNEKAGNNHSGEWESDTQGKSVIDGQQESPFEEGGHQFKGRLVLWIECVPPLTPKFMC
jgi:hypothetical protein